MTYRVYPLPRAPQLRRMPGPAPGAELAQEIDRQRRHIAASPHLHNGHLLRVLQVSTQQISLFSCDFAYTLAAEALEWEQMPTQAQPRAHYRWGLGNLNSALLLQHRDDWLWQFRSSALLYDPDCWQLGAGGMVEQHETPRQTALREAQEEIGLQAGWLRELRPVALGWGGGIGACLVYSARLPDAFDRKLLQPSGSESTELCWCPTQQTPPGPIAYGIDQHLRLTG